MKRSIWLLFFLPLVLTGIPAYGGIINLMDLLSTGTCITPPDPSAIGAGQFGFPAGCWSLQNQAPDKVLDATGNAVPNTSPSPNGTAFEDMSSLTVTGSDGLVDMFGDSMSSFTEFTTLITADTPGVTDQGDGTTFSGDLTVNWRYTTVDAGSFYDPAGYIVCSAAPSGFPNGECGLFQLTSDYNALADPNAVPGPYMESGSFTAYNLAPGDVFGAYVLTADNEGGAGTIVFSAALAPTPEPASFLLIGGGLLVLGRARRQAKNKKLR
jgi:hypothetical protein